MSRNSAVLVAAFVVSLSPAALAQQQQVALAPNRAARPESVVRSEAVAVRARPAAPHVDGRLDEAAWALAQPFGGFVQREPHQGQPATERTDVRVLFSDDAIYVGIRAWDTHADQIVGQLTRRDQHTPSDWVGVAIDSYHDRQTAFYFQVNAAGVKRDVYLFNDVNDDDSWDAVWDVATSRDAEGWTAEFRIPFSQLRFARGTSSFGFNVTREIPRLNEESHWRLVPQNSNAVVSLFGDLNGLDGVQPPRRLEVLPYTVARAENRIPETGNPFAPATASSATAGADIKLGLGSNLTLDATINPDFGQVEADPAIVNLGRFESFYPERRPFFSEGVNIFRFPILLGDGDGANEQLFYSRRVGRRPQAGADPRGGYAESVDHTTILGAAKLSGKTRSGWTLGLLGALTREMEAEVRDSAGVAHRDVVEPRTGYVVGRLARDFRQGRTVVGLFGTLTHRDLPASLDWLRRDAVSLGIDWNHRFASDHYRIRGWVVGSRVAGSAEAIALTQTSPTHLYQRPDNDYTVLDTTRTSLSGLAGQLIVGKENGIVRFMTGFDTRTPGFEVNDAGYQREADRTIQFAWVGLRFNQPGKVFRRINVNFNQNTVYNWGWDRTGAGGNVNANVTFANYFSAYGGINRNLGGLANELRGGPGIVRPGDINGWGGFGTDQRKRVYGEFNGWFFSQDESGAHGGGIDPYVQWRPSGRMDFSVGPSMSWNHDTWQYLTTQAVQNTDEYFFGELDQTTVSLRLRGNITFRPTLSLQVYAEPFYSAGRYLGVQRVLDPRGARWSDRMAPLPPAQLTRETGTGDFLVDLDQDAATDVRIANPDFSFRSFRSNVVLRWEYRPGSTVFVVWQQGRNGFSSDGRYRFGDAARNVFSARPENVFLVKVNYWLSL